MSDGALPNPASSPTNNQNTPSTTTHSPPSLRSVSPSANSNNSNINNSPSPTVISARAPLSRSGRMPFPHSVTNMRYRRMSSGRDSAIGVSINANVPVSVRSTTFGLSDHVNSDSGSAYGSVDQANNNSNDHNGVDDTTDSFRNGIPSAITTGISIGGGGSSTGATSIQGNATSVSSSPRSTDSRTSTLVSSSLADLDTMPEHDILAVFNRIFDDYTGPPTSDVFGQQQHQQGNGSGNSNNSNNQQHHSPLYLSSRVPTHARQRLAMRIPNAYLIPGRRHGRGGYGSNGNSNSNNGNNGEGSGIRIGMGLNHSQHHQHQHENHHQRHMHHHYHHGHAGPMTLHGAFGVEDREIRLNMHTMGIGMGMGIGPDMFNLTGANGNGGAGRGCENRVASDEEINALPSFVMEKGETRSVRQVFASMRAEKKKAKKGADKDDTSKSNEVSGELDDIVDTVVVDDEEDEDEAKEGCGEGEKTDKDEGAEVGNGETMTSYTECAICLCDFEPGDEITSLPCGHCFHLNECVREWLSKHARTCPTCRADICETRVGAEELN